MTNLAEPYGKSASLPTVWINTRETGFVPVSSPPGRGCYDTIVGLRVVRRKSVSPFSRNIDAVASSIQIRLRGTVPVRSAALCLLAVTVAAGFLFPGCHRKPDPRMLIPADSEAWIAFDSSSGMAPDVRQLVSMAPESSGLFEMVRSVSGFDPSDPRATSDAGVDPERGVVAAWWRGGVLVMLPLSDERTAGRRTALRLARFGFVQTSESAGVKRFKSPRYGNAVYAAGGGVAVLFAGPEAGCEAAVALTNNVDSAADNAPDRVGSTAAELGLPGAAVVGRAGAALYADALFQAAGLPERGTAASLVRGMIGDFRVAIDISDGVAFRAAAGQEGGPIPRGLESEHGMPDNVAASAVFSAGPAVKPFFESAVTWCRKRCASPWMKDFAALWNGRAAIALASSNGTGRPAVPAAAIRDLFGRAVLVGAAGTKTDIAESGGLFDEWTSVAPLAPDVEGEVAPQPVAGPKERGFVLAGIGFVPAGRERLLYLASRSLSGLNGDPASDSERVIAAAAPAGRLLSTAQPADRVLSFRAVPAALLDVTGLSTLDFAKHLADPVSEVSLDIYYQEGRVLADGRAVFRTKGNRNDGNGRQGN